MLRQWSRHLRVYVCLLPSRTCSAATCTAVRPSRLRRLEGQCSCSSRRTAGMRFQAAAQYSGVQPSRSVTAISRAEGAARELSSNTGSHNSQTLVHSTAWHPHHTTLSGQASHCSSVHAAFPAALPAAIAVQTTHLGSCSRGAQAPGLPPGGPPPPPHAWGSTPQHPELPPRTPAQSGPQWPPPAQGGQAVRGRADVRYQVSDAGGDTRGKRGIISRLQWNGKQHDTHTHHTHHRHHSAAPTPPAHPHPPAHPPTWLYAAA